MSERDEFEEWAIDSFGFLCSDPSNVVDQCGLGMYSRSHVGAAWQAWQAARRSQWRPIESAPKDGTVILIKGHMVESANPQVSAAFWLDASGWQWWFFDPRTHISTDSDMLNAVPDGETGPTHWRPMPEPTE